jgi:hypothetical protein
LNIEEIAARLKIAAEAELFAINELEAFAARPHVSPAVAQTVAHVRQQADALGRAYRILIMLAANPGIANSVLPGPEA